MPLPVLLAVDEDPDGRNNLETQLQRYARDYRVECPRDSEKASRTLTELVDDGAEIALVLAGQVGPAANPGLFDHVRQFHPHAKRALLVSPTAWADEGTADAIRASIALGRIDYYLPRPASSRDEVFHESVSSFLLDWALERRTVPHTVHIVGEAWSGRAYELRSVFEGCAVPHAFCLAESDQGRELLAKAGPDAKLPLMVLPDGRALSDPSNAEIA